MRSLARLFTTIAIVLLPFMSNAHGYWIETEGNHKANEIVTVKMYYGDYPAGEKLSGKSLDRMKDIKVFVTNKNGGKQEIAMKQTNNYWEGTFTPSADGVYEITGVNDVREVQDWTKHNLGITRPVQYLKAVYMVGAGKAGKDEPLFLDIKIKSTKDGNYEAVITKDSKPLAAQKVIMSAYGAEELELTTDKKGKTAFRLVNPGLYIISIDWIDNTPGEFKGKKYETVRHRLDYSVYK